MNTQKQNSLVEADVHAIDVSSLNKGLIYTNSNCIGCNKCISGCPVLGANIAIEESGVNRINVDGSKCIHCGHCLETCPHDAREYRDDTNDFFASLKQGQKISILVAPSFYVNYPNQYKQVFGYLKSLGVKHIYNVSFGADITTWAYLKYIEEYNFIGGISQPCPAVVNYIEKYVPYLIDKLMPIHSPLLCGAIYVKDYLKDNNKLAFLSPCIAKKDEISAKETNGIVTYNITYKHLFDALSKIPLSSYSAEDDTADFGFGSLYPMPGGLKENVEHFVGYDKFVRQIEGEDRIYHYFHDYKKRLLKSEKLPLLVDVLNCSQGCNFGTGTESKLTNNDDLLFEMQKLRGRITTNSKTDPYDRSISYKERMKRLNAHFKDLNLHDFIRHYNKSMFINEKDISDKELNDAYQLLNKSTQEMQTINCGSCGYDSCKHMARAIVHGYNRKENCVHYMKDEILADRNEMSELVKKLQDKTDLEKQFEEIFADINTLNETINELSKGNTTTCEQTQEIASSLTELSRYSDALKESLSSISDFIETLNDSNTQIVNISSQTNMLALNASIEAARSGESGKAFAVIANRVKELADQTKHAVEAGKNSSEVFAPAIANLSEKAEDFINHIGQINEKTQEIATASEEITAMSQTLETVVASIVCNIHNVMKDFES